MLSKKLLLVNYYYKGVPMKQSARETDMTQGNIIKQILIFSIPLFIGNLVQQFYNLVDTIVVGKFVSDEALAATGACGSVGFLFFSLSSGLSVGIGVIASHDYGAKNEKKLRQTIANSFYVLISAALVVTLLGVVLARPLMELLHTPAHVIEDSVLYLRITCLGIIFIALYNGVSSILRAIGDSKMPLVFLIISSLLNIAFDLIFVLVFHMGVFGVGLATVIAQAISAAVSLIYAFIYVPYFKLTREEMRPHFGIIANSFSLGIPVALQSSMIAISLMALQDVVNKFDSTAIMDAFTISGKVDILASILYNTMGVAFTTFAGQNLGALKFDRIRRGFKIGMLINTCYTALIVPLILIFSRQIVSIFTSNPDIIEVCRGALNVATWFYFALGSIHIPRGVLNGCGDAKFALINGLTEVVCRILFANLLVNIPLIGVWGIWWAGGLTWTFTAAVCIFRYLSTIKKLEAQSAASSL